MPSRVVWPAPRQIEIEEFEVEAPGPGEVQLAAELTLISPGTERGWLTDAIGFPTFPEFRGGFPFRPGYSFTGVVEAVGDGVTRLTAGDRVISGNFGWGCHASHVTFPELVVDPIPDAVPFEQAVFFGLADVAIFGVRRARIELGESVVVLGQGPIGLLCTQIARLSGAVPVIAVDPSADRRAMASTAGADLVFAPDDPLFAETAAALPGGGPDVILELTARREPLDQALAMIAPRGRIIMVTADSNPYTANLHQGLFAKGASLTGVFTAARPQSDSQPGSWTPAADRDAFLSLVANGRLDVSPLITDRYPADQAAAAYRRLLDADPSMVGCLLDWRAPTVH